MQQDNSLSAEIHAFIQRVFHNCNIQSKYYPDHQAWKFHLQFEADRTKSFHICPPAGCCLMKVQAMGQTVTFEITVFVDQFIAYHLRKIAN